MSATALALGPGTMRVDPLGVILIAAACACWALDNNLTATLTTRDPVALVATKVTVAGVFNLAVALARPRATPNPSLRLIAAALVLGAFSYGLSVLLDTYALRALGAGREAALFATAPFAGALLAIPILGDGLTALTATALGAMAAGMILLLTDTHRHSHQHIPLVHDHRHNHDEHHHHAHTSAVSVTEPHAHPHQHDQLVHAHPHASDLHHRHPH